MCGIVGIYNYKKVSRKFMTSMSKKINHRGPDSNDIYLEKKNNLGLASLRLAIVDASKEGNQPTHSFLGRFVMVYNGEIYNYLELRNIVEKNSKEPFRTPWFTPDAITSRGALKRRTEGLVHQKNLEQSWKRPGTRRCERSGKRVLQWYIGITKRVSMAWR